MAGVSRVYISFLRNVYEAAIEMSAPWNAGAESMDNTLVKDAARATQRLRPWKRNSAVYGDIEIRRARLCVFVERLQVVAIV